MNVCSRGERLLRALYMLGYNGLRPVRSCCFGMNSGDLMRFTHELTINPILVNYLKLTHFQLIAPVNQLPVNRRER